MADIFSKRKRSDIMRKIGPKNSSHELHVRKLVFSMGYRFRLHRKDLPGKPDIVFPNLKKVIFVNGCFWHGCKKCKRSKLPDSNKEFWEDKIGKNVIRDRKNNRMLKKAGWDYYRIWQCEIKKKNEEKLRTKLNMFLRN